MDTTTSRRESFTLERLDRLRGIAHKTPELARLLARRSDLSNEFSRYLLSMAEPTALAFDAIMSAFDELAGVELRHENGRQWCVLLDEASQQGRRRFQMFDMHGFYSHETFDTWEEVVNAAVRAGFRTPDSGALERLAASRCWARGTETAALIQKLNSRKVTLEAFAAQQQAMRARWEREDEASGAVEA